MTSSLPFVSIVIVTRDNEQDTIDCLNSLLNLDYPVDSIEIVIWDNNSTAKSKDRLRSSIDQIQPGFIKLIEHHENLGVYTSRDEVFHRTRDDAKYILSLDDDVILPPSSLRAFVAFAQEHPNVAVIGPRVMYADYPDQVQSSARFVDWRWAGRFSMRDSNIPLDCDWVIGCCMFVRRDIFIALGGFDRDFYTSQGEVDFCLRVVRSGSRVVYLPTVVIKHRVDLEGTQTCERLYYLVRNKFLMFKKNAPTLAKVSYYPFYYTLWLPRLILVQIRRQMANSRKMDLNELRIIAIAAWHALSGKTGRYDLDNNGER